MPNFSKDPLVLLEANLAESYVGARVMQGVPVLDRDLNLSAELVAATLRRVLRDHLGDGTPRGVTDQFKIVPLNPPANDFVFRAGSLLAGGIQVTTGLSQYSAQGLPALVPPGPATRIDLVYLDLWLEQIDSTGDPALFNPDDYELQTSVRLTPRFAVRVAQAGVFPPLQSGHVRCTLAELVRPANSTTISTSMLTDKRATGLDLPAATHRVDLAEAHVEAVKSGLPPVVAAEPYSHAYGYPGLRLTIHGHHLTLGDPQVELARASSSTDPAWLEAPLVGVPEPTALTVRIPNGITGPARIAITTALGRIEAPSFFIFGPPRFVEPQIGSLLTDVGSTVTIYGEFFDMPGAIVEVASTSTPGVWKPVTIVADSATPTQIKFKAPLVGGSYSIRVRTLASPLAAVSLVALDVWEI